MLFELVCELLPLLSLATGSLNNAKMLCAELVHHAVCTTNIHTIYHL